METEHLLSTIYLFIQIPLSVYILLLFILLLLFISALISGSEVAFFSLTPQQIEECEHSEKFADKNILYLLSQPQRLLATILIINNLVNVAIVTLATFTLWQFTSNRKEGWLIAILTVIVTAAIVFFGEITPKVLATKRNIFFARFTVRILMACSWMLQPFSSVLIKFNKVLARNEKKQPYDVSVSELNKAVEMTAEQSTEEEKEILKGVVNFGTKTVKQIMRSRIEITAFDREESFTAITEKINQSGFSRIPVYDSTIDSIKGILYIKDLLPYLNERENFNWVELIRKQIFFVPENKKIDGLLKDFQERRVHMAIVVDEYGGTSGLVTMEDVIEEVVGEINDEFDSDELKFEQLDERTFSFESKTSLNDFSKIVDVDSSIFADVKSESESLGGLLLELFSKLPAEGEQITFQNFVFTAMAVDKKRIKNVKVQVKKLVTEN